MEIPYWFDEEWINTDSKALGLYIALLYSRFKCVLNPYCSESDCIMDIKEEIDHILTEDVDVVETWKVAEEFILALYSNHRQKRRVRATFGSFKKTFKIYTFKENTLALLEQIELMYYEIFRKICYKYFREKVIKEIKFRYEKYLKKDVKKILKCMKLTHAINTLKGSIKIERTKIVADLYECLTYESFHNLEADKKSKVENKLRSILNILHYTGILWFGEIIPAPFLEDKFIEKLAPPEEIEKTKTKEIETPVKTKEEKEELRKKYEGKAPTGEILEGIVKDVLEDLGFKVETNKKLDARGGGKMEVDVWGMKLIKNTGFYFYASCKNWDREIDRSVIDEEFGRTLQLVQTPHLKTFIAKRLTDPARQTALADGFFIIELGEKATTNNARELYEIIYKHLRELFIGIAPPELQKLAKEAREISERLKVLAEEVERISG